MQVEHFAIRQNAGSIGVRRRGRNEKRGERRRPVRLRGFGFAFAAPLRVTGGVFALRLIMLAPARSAARDGNKLPVAPNKYLKKGKITLFPFFPYEHTDGGECGAIL